uniref:Uncharacterized protein n=1 Tax=Glossina austeni TaxID=7395 RepID=A0A1A9V8I4_GLOAU
MEENNKSLSSQDSKVAMPLLSQETLLSSSQDNSHPLTLSQFRTLENSLLNAPLVLSQTQLISPNWTPEPNSSFSITGSQLDMYLSPRDSIFDSSGWDTDEVIAACDREELKYFLNDSSDDDIFLAIDLLRYDIVYKKLLNPPSLRAEHNSNRAAPLSAAAIADAIESTHTSNLISLLEAINFRSKHKAATHDDCQA